MAHYGTLRDYRFSDTETADDIRGSSVYGRDDEKLGKIDDVIFDHASGNIQYVVIDTGGWLSSKKFIVSPSRLRASRKHEDDFQMSATKKEIEGFPTYNEDDVRDADRWKDYEKRYQAAWHDSPVQHRKGSDRDITPTPDEMPAQPGSNKAAVLCTIIPNLPKLLRPSSRAAILSSSSIHSRVEASTNPLGCMING